MDPTLYVRKLRLAAACAGIAFLAACGGGGGGDGGGGGGGGSTPPSPPLVYAGATTAAVITPTNAGRMAANMMGSGEVAMPSVVAGVQATVASGQTSGTAGLTRRLDLALRTGDLKRARGPAGLLAGFTVDQTQNCDSGTVRVQGALSDTDSTGTLNVTYNACRTGSDTLNGAATMRIDAFDAVQAVITDFTITYPRVTFTFTGTSVDLSGTLRSQITLSTNTEVVTENIVTQNNATGLMTKTENMVIVDVYNNVLSPSSLSESVSGRVFDGAAGYIDLSTITPMFFSSGSQSFPDRGQVLISGAGNARIRLSALSAVLAKIEIDSNGDSTFENSATLKWADLSGPIGADLGDNDGDGMHNSWETAYGLDPNSAADALADKDGDGASNLLEYQTGTDPGNAASKPAGVNLSLNIYAPSTVVMGSNLSFSIAIWNSSGDAAGVVVTYPLPPNVTLVSATPSQGSCSGTSTISCALGTVSGNGNASVNVVVAPTALGVITHTANVTTSSYEPNTSDNSATAYSTVGVATVDLTLYLYDAPDPVPNLGNLTYTVNVYNFSANSAANVVVTDSLPAGVNFVSATTTVGTCAGTSTVSCAVGTLASYGSATVTINVQPTVPGSISNTANVSTTTAEPQLANNTATVSTTVGTAVAGLQARLDAAAPGDTITVDPGVYAGPLNFKGKNITLQSRDGPATTILSGGYTVVTMGPGGTLRGFTITGGTATFGAGLAVSGTGSLITGNIFDGNAEGSGGYGAAIGGNVASPTIERNIFRNNTCDSQWLSGVVSFINGSEPRIVNNVFENNPCTALNLSLPTGYAPQVVNNTFVGNSGGVRINRQVAETAQIYRNNVFVGNGVGLKFDFGSDADNPVWTNNLMFGNTTDYQGTASQTGVNGNVSADPRFVDQAGGNYRLQAGSPAVDAGSTLQAPTIDFDGVARPRGAGWDIGAFESQ